MGTPTTRRTLLGLGAGAVLGTTVPLLGGGAPTSALASAARKKRFPGDPGVGRLYFGASVGTAAQADAFSARVGNMGAERGFCESNEIDKALSRSAAAVGGGRLPMVSIKPPASWRAVAAGTSNAWLDELLDGLAGVDAPVCLTVHHEPENDADGVDNTPWTHRAMTEFVLERARTRAPQVTVHQTLMRWTFASESGRKPRQWISKAPALFGIDAYNPWQPGTSKPWTPLRSLLLPVIDVVGDRRPLVIGEYGTRNDPASPQRGAIWLRSALTFAVNHNVAAMAYFNGPREDGDSSIKLDGERLKEFKKCVADTRTVKLRG
jgi:hypothetical protein